MPLYPPQAYRKTAYTHRVGERADQPLATDVLEGTLYYVTDEGIIERSDGTAWSVYSGAGSRVSNLVNYSYSVNPASPPGTNQVRFNAGHPYTTVTKLYFDNVTADGQDIHIGLIRVSPGSLIYVQDKNDNTRYATFLTTAFPTDNTSWVEFDVVHYDNGLAIGGGQLVLVQSTWGPVQLPTFTEGSVPFSNASGVLTEDNANLFFDNTNNRLGIRTATPSYPLDILRDNITNTTNVDAAAASYRNTQASTGGAQTQHAPSLIYEGHAWQSGGGGSDKLLRIILQGRVVPDASAPVMYLSFTSYNGTSFTDEIYMGGVLGGSAPDLRFRDGNIIFSRSGRGISFVATPLSDAIDANFLISGDVSGSNRRIKFNAVPGYVFIEGNNFGFGAGTVPMMDFRGFDDSVSSPITQIRFRGTPGGTVANGFGSALFYQANSSTTADQDQGRFDCIWSDVTHASRTSKFNFYLVNSAAALALKFEMLASGVFYTSAAAFMIGSRASYTDGAGVGLGTLTNAPAAGDPTKWIPVDDNGTTRYVPAW